MFNKSISKLVPVPTTERDQSFYNEVVAAFGTHYVSSVIVGGVAQYFTLLTNEWQRTSNQMSTETQISLGFHLGFDIPITDDISIGFGKEFGGISFGGNWGTSSGFQTELFKKNSATKILMRPSPLGSSSSIQNHSLEAWATQAARQPVVVNRTLFPLSNLLLEYPEAIAEHLQSTIDFYLTNGSLPNLRDVSRKGRLLTDTSVSIPGLDVVGCGYNIMNFSSKQCIFEVTYNNNNLWPHVFNGHISYRLPDGFSVQGTQEFSSTYDTQIFDDYNKFIQHSLYLNNQDAAGFLGFGVSLEHREINRALRNMFKHHLDLAWTKRQIQWYNLSIVNPSSLSLNSAAQTALNDLPSIFSEEEFETVWKSFFDTYGTHYVVSADFGGMMWLEDYFDPCMLAKYSSQWIKDQISHSYWFISTGQYNCLVIPPTDKNYVRHSVSVMKVLGGQSDTNPRQVEKWLQTIKDRPSAIGFNLRPLYTLLPIGSQKREALEKATLYIRLQAVNVTNTFINNLNSGEWPLPAPPMKCNSL